MKTQYIPTASDVAAAFKQVFSGRKVAVVFSPDLKNRIRVSAKRFKRSSRHAIQDIVVTIGRPNYLEREFLKLCRKEKTKPKRVWLPSR